MIRLVWTNDAPDPYHLALLQQGVNIWNDWRRENPKIIPSFHKANLSGADLNHANFKTAEFKEANLSGANLSGAAFGKAILTKADLSKTNLSGAGFFDADLSESNFADANLHCTHFSKSELNNSKFNKASFTATKLADTNCNQVDFSDATFHGIEIQRTNFSEANFSNATFNHAIFLGARLYRTNFSGSTLNDVKMPNAYLHGAKFTNATLIGIDLSGSDLSNVDFSDADLTGADLSDANLSNANFHKAILNKACLARVKAIGTDFSGAELTGACIEDWNINKANLNDVSCQYVYLRNPDENRCPVDREFTEREFTKRFQISQNILEIAFSDGMPWRSFAYAFHEVNLQVLDEYDDELFLQEYKVLGEGLAVLKISYPPSADNKKIQELLVKRTHELELQVAHLEGEVRAKDVALSMFERLLSTNYAVITEPHQIHAEDIESFQKIRDVDINSISHFLKENGYLDISEDKIQVGLERILNEKFHKKDWGGEYNDLFTSNLLFKGSRKSTAFLLKGNGLKVATMEIKHCGKNGDQLLRLFESPAELFVIQFVGNISESIIKDVEGKVEQLRAKGKQSHYCLINGVDTARLMYAYGLL